MSPIIIIYCYFSRMKICYSLLFFLTFSFYAQNIDSLESIVSSLKGKEKAVVLSDLCYYLSASDVVKSEKYGNVCLNLAIELNDSVLIANAYNDLSILYTLKSNYKKGLAYNLKAYEIRKKLNDPDKMISSLSKIGVCYSELTEFENASKYLIEAIKIVEDNGLENKYYLIYDNLGGLYKEMEDYNDALIYYTKAHDYAVELKNEKSIILTLVNMANVYHKKGDYDKSLELHLKAEENIEMAADYRTKALIYSNLTTIYSVRNDVKKALAYSEKSIPYYQALSNYDGLSLIYNNIAGIYLENYEVKENQAKVLHNLNLAKAYADSSESLIRILNNVESFGTYYLFVGDYTKSKEYRHISDSLQKMIYNSENNKLVEELTLKYQTEKKEKEIELLNKSNLLKDADLKRGEEERKRKSAQLQFAFSIVIALVILAVVFFRNNLHKKKNNALLVQKNTEIMKQKHIVEEQNTDILSSIIYAKRIQTAILPTKKVEKENLSDSFVLYKPKDIVAGDFYWIENKNGIVLFAAADCTGHGVPGAMVSVVCNNALNRAVREYGLSEPGEILDKTREIVIEEFGKSDEDVKDGMDIALCSLDGNVLKYAGANNPLWIVSKGEVIETKANKQPIGKCENQEPYTTHTFELSKNDTIYIFSDGFVDQFGGDKGKKLKASAFREILLSIEKESMETQMKIIDETFEAWKGDLEQIDDVCIIGVRA